MSHAALPRRLMPIYPWWYRLTVQLHRPGLQLIQRDDCLCSL